MAGHGCGGTSLRSRTCITSTRFAFHRIAGSATAYAGSKRRAASRAASASASASAASAAAAAPAAPSAPPETSQNRAPPASAAPRRSCGGPEGHNTHRGAERHGRSVGARGGGDGVSRGDVPRRERDGQPRFVSSSGQEDSRPNLTVVRRCEIGRPVANPTNRLLRRGGDETDVTLRGPKRNTSVKTKFPLADPARADRAVTTLRTLGSPLLRKD